MMPADSILMRFLSGKATPEEAAMIDGWIQSSAQNKQAFEQVWQHWQQAIAKGDYATPVASDEWQKLNQQLAKQSSIAGRSSWGRIALIVGIAAIIVVIILIFVNRKSSSQHTAIPAIMIDSKEQVLTDTLSDHVMITFDQHSKASRSGESILFTHGDLYLQADTLLKEPVTVRAGDLTVYANTGDIHIAVDSITNTVWVQALHGDVTIAGNQEKMQLAQGKAISYSGRQHHFNELYPVNVNAFSFATKIFYFNDTPLSDAVRYLEKAYAVTIDIKNPAIANCRITTRFDNKSIEYIMDIMSATLHFEYDYQPQQHIIFISGEGCN